MKNSDIKICPICNSKMIIKDLHYTKDSTGYITRIERQQWCGCGYRGEPFTVVNPPVDDKLMQSWLSINNLKLKDK